MDNKMRKLIFITAIVLLASLTNLYTDDNYITYTETFSWLGQEGGDPEFIFAEFIENGSLYYVAQKFTSGIKEYYEPIIYFENGEYHFIYPKIYNNKEYKIKLFKDRLRKKEKPRPYIPNPNPQTIIVDINGTGDYTIIQEGINNALGGDIVLVYPGTYYENIDYSGKNITVASKYYTTGVEVYIDDTIIDGDDNGSCVLINSDEINAYLIGFTLQHGNGFYANNTHFGGGINIHSASLIIEKCEIKNNKAGMGGGIYVGVSQNTSLKGTNIYNNFSSIQGGGVCKQNDAEINFSQQDLCNIYMNYSPMGSDIYNHDGDMTVYVDTFTVQEPDKFYVYSPEDNVTMNILHNKIEPINQDIFVSPYGNNSNNGLNGDEAFNNIYHALIMVKSDSTNPNTIHVEEGFYSPSATGEFFALGGKEHISIIGVSKELTILDAEQTNKLFLIENVSEFAIQKMTLQHGYDRLTGGIYIDDNSHPIIKHLYLVDNNISGELGKVHISCQDYSNPIFEHVTVTSSNEINSRAIGCASNCNPIFINCDITNNKSNPLTGNFGAMVAVTNSYPILINCAIANNYGDICSGIRATYGPDENIYLINCTVVNNDHCLEGTISLVYDAHVTLINTILRNDPETEIWFHPQHDPNSVSVEYCNIEGGIDAIDTNNNGTVYWGDGNIDEDPLFVGGDPFSYELTKYSPCIDAGTPDTIGLHLPATDLAGNPRIFNGRIDIGAYECQDTVSVDNPDTSFIHNLYLFQNTPNPFANETEILFITADYERVEDYTLSIYNTKGQLVRRFDGTTHDFWVKTKIVWNGTDEQGKQVAPGTYLYKLEYNGQAVVRKMVKLR